MVDRKVVGRGKCMVKDLGLVGICVFLMFGMICGLYGGNSCEWIDLVLFIFHLLFVLDFIDYI